MERVEAVLAMSDRGGGVCCAMCGGTGVLAAESVPCHWCDGGDTIHLPEIIIGTPTRKPTRHSGGGGAGYGSGDGSGWGEGSGGGLGHGWIRGYVRCWGRGSGSGDGDGTGDCS